MERWIGEHETGGGRGRWGRRPVGGEVTRTGMLVGMTADFTAGPPATPIPPDPIHRTRAGDGA
ncbi:hypothetical protein [Streptosporangium sp. NPDC023615]|uniref:hypothetical protein n=1 Tax=Streptosporangium sp. NPDC023615 TaxID=3154794 RepID=UPI003446A709